MHLAFDLLERWDALIMVDALPERGRVGEVVVIEIGHEDVGGCGQANSHVDAHGMDPATVLASLAAFGGRLPQRTLLVGCPVAETGEGMGLTQGVQAAVDEAVRVVRSQVAGVLQPTEVA
jgi:hydrogenase maturation protease